MCAAKSKILKIDRAARIVAAVKELQRFEREKEELLARKEKTEAAKKRKLFRPFYEAVKLVKNKSLRNSAPQTLKDVICCTNTIGFKIRIPNANHDSFSLSSLIDQTGEAYLYVGYRRVDRDVNVNGVISEPKATRLLTEVLAEILDDLS